MRIINEPELNLDDVLLMPQRTTLESRSQVQLERELRFYHYPKHWVGVPFFAANLACLSSFELGRALAKHKMCTALHKFHSPEQLINFYDESPHEDQLFNFFDKDNKLSYVWVSIGMNDEDITNLEQVKKKIEASPNIVIDVPNAYLEKFTKYCAKVRDAFPDSIIMAGNCISGEIVQELILHGGIDIVKIQIGNGKLCTTRLMTGVGRGTLSCIIECAGAAHGLKNGEKRLGLVCSDGGLYNTGDCSKAFCGGADFLMSGGLFYGVDEACGEWEYEHILNPLDNVIHETIRKKRLKIYGMSSKESQIRHYGEYKKYRASEGRSQYADYKGKADEVVQELLGGLRSTATYIGANSLKDFNKCAVFCKVNQIHPNMSV